MGRTESEENAVREPGRPVSRDQLTRWAESCLRMQHLDDLVQRTIWMRRRPGANSEGLVCITSNIRSSGDGKQWGRAAALGSLNFLSFGSNHVR